MKGHASVGHGGAMLYAVTLSRQIWSHFIHSHWSAGLKAKKKIIGKGQENTN